MDSEQLVEIANSCRAVANSITPRAAVGGKDATGGHVESLTEAVMGVTAGLCRIADALEKVADAITDHADR